MPSFRSVKRVLERPYPHWVGDGFQVHAVFADLAFKEDLSPLLMFDYAPPKKFGSKVGKPRGVGQHPHRGEFLMRLYEIKHCETVSKNNGKPFC